jgi:hypothetical protein
LNRRQFLKYAGATTAVVGSSALGLNYLLTLTSPSSQTFTSLPEIGSTTTQSGASSIEHVQTTMQTSATGASQSLVLGQDELGGYAFHDYNGNGILDENEPLLDNIEVVARGYNNTFRTKTENGIFVFRNLPKDTYTIYPVHPQNKFRYMCRSNAELVETNRGYSIDFRGRQRLDMALMEGFLTLPILPSTRYEIDRFYDHNPDPPRYLWWNNVTGYDKDLGRGYSPNHPGIDYHMQEGNPLPSPAPGTVDSVGEDPGGKYIFIKHTNDLKSSCGHISTAVVNKGDVVARGQIIAISGKSGKNTELANYPHNHFQLIYREHFAIDPYRPEFTPTQQNCGYYDASRTDAATGSFPWIPITISDENLVMPNYWTKKNDPQYPPSSQ